MMSNRWLRYFLFGFLITLSVSSIEFVAIDKVQQFLQRIEGILYDVRLLATLPSQPRTTDEHIIIIDIDEKSMQEQGRYPWSRRKVSTLVEKLMTAGVTVVAFDIVFAEPEENPVTQLLSYKQDLSPQALLEIKDVAPEIDADTRFASILAQSEVVLGFMLDEASYLSTEEATARTHFSRHIGTVPTSHVVSTNSQAFADKTEVPIFESILGNIPVLQQAASGSGFINSTADGDGFIRKASLLLDFNGKFYPSLALETARVYTLADKLATTSIIHDSSEWLQAITLQDKVIPVNEKGQILIPFKGAQGSFDYYSATDILKDRIPSQELEGAIAFVGTSAIGLADLRATSVGIQYPGVEIHANVFESLLHPEMIPVVPDTILGISLLILLLTGIVLSATMSARGPLAILLLCVAAVLFHVGLNWYVWAVHKVSLPLFLVLLLISLLTFYYGAMGFVTEISRRRNIKDIFDQYVPPAYIDKLIQQGKGDSIKPELKHMSVLFADIRNFTQLSEGFSAQELSEFMREYLSEITGVIFENNGTIDKYVGDMVMAFWNAPLDDEYHAKHAVITALQMINKAEELTTVFQRQGWPAVKIGIGISTGEMNVGDMGSHYRKAYTVLGDNVNLGSRIESLTKYYGVDILITDNTFNELAEQDIVCRLIDTIKVKGKQDAHKVYEPLGLTSTMSREMVDTLATHNRMIVHYMAQEWKCALDLLILLKQQKYFSSIIYDKYYQRIKEREHLPRDEQWNGIYVHKNK